MRDFEKDFREWFELSGFYWICYNAIDNPFHENPRSQEVVEYLKNLPFSMQWGVYIDFFDEHGIEVAVNKRGYVIGLPNVDDDIEINFDYSGFEVSRKAALEKAKEIYNNKI